MSRILLAIFGFLLISGGYLYYQSETITTTNSEAVVLNEPHKAKATSTPAPKKPSERALRASVGAFLLMNKEQAKTYLDKFSEDNDVKEAVVNLALLLDADNTKLSNVENIIASSQASQSGGYEYTNPSSDTTNYNDTYDYEDSYKNSSNNYLDSDWNYAENDGSNNNWNGGKSYSDNKSLRYNSFNNSWEYAGENESLRYNAFENDWEYASDDESTRYNAFENRWEFAGDDERTKYNAFENTWEYAPDDSVTKYNSFENKWEITNPDSSLKYNAFENTWSYE